MFEVQLEDGTGILMVKVLGAWTRTEVHRYRLVIRELLPEARRRFGGVRILVDSRRGKAVPQDLLAPLARVRDGLMHADDRIAGLVESSMRKMQVRNTVANPNWQLFLSEAAARTWLTAMDYQLARAG